MRFRENNFAFIDGQNVNLGIRELGWRLDFRKFRVYLAEKHGVSKSYLFLGYIPNNQKLYDALRDDGHTLIFKPTILHANGTAKGNCDAELVLQALIDFEKYDKALIATGDGDFHCLIDYLLGVEKLEALLIPNQYKFSGLLKMKRFGPHLEYMNELKDKLAYIKRGPRKDGTLKG
jgi:uncharacterized LabA/DUF88 family protein